MSILDQPERCQSIDPQSMKALVESFPEQIRSAAQNNLELSLSASEPIHGKPKALIVAGLGGSAIGGDLARSVAGPFLKTPLIVVRDYDLPGFVDASSVVFACSYSGNTEETLSAYQQARRGNAYVVCITSGGRLQEMAKADAYPVLSLPPGLPPRAALGYSLITLLGAMQSMKLIPNMAESIGETVNLMSELRNRYGSANPQHANPAKRLAHSLKDKIVTIYGSNGIMNAVAFRWRSQIAENAKNLAFHHVLPEMNHNELVGWRYPEEILSRIGVVLLRDKGDHPQIQRRFDLTRELIGDKAGAVHEVWSEGNSPLARIMSAIYLGDFLSLYLAYLNNIDPTPVEVIDYFKSKLSKAD
jgi:glucose/mannose-6-phosphate isomerase